LAHTDERQTTPMCVAQSRATCVSGGRPCGVTQDLSAQPKCRELEPADRLAAAG